MTESRVAVFSLGRAPQHGSFLAWASLVGPQVGLLHLPKGYKKARDGTSCHCEVYEEDVVEEAIRATVRRTTSLRSAPPFVFLDSRVSAAVTEVSDPRIWSTDLKQVRLAMWDFVAAEAEYDPVDEPEPAQIESLRKTSTRAPLRTPSVPMLGPGGKPWWCKLFRSAPGCCRWDLRQA